jgi:hypothetical protein
VVVVFLAVDIPGVVKVDVLENGSVIPDADTT